MIPRSHWTNISQVWDKLVVPRSYISHSRAIAIQNTIWLYSEKKYVPNFGTRSLRNVWDENDGTRLGQVVIPNLYGTATIPQGCHKIFYSICGNAIITHVWDKLTVPTYGTAIITQDWDKLVIPRFHRTILSPIWDKFEVPWSNGTLWSQICPMHAMLAG